MARDKVELLVQLVGKDGVTKILDAAATEALRLEQNLKKGSNRTKKYEKRVSRLKSSWSDVAVGVSSVLDITDRLVAGAEQVLAVVQETARARDLERRFVDQLNVSVQGLREASGFRMDDVSLKRFALQAKNAGVSMDQFRKLLDVTLRASVATGKDFEEVFEGLFVDTVLGATDSYLEQLGIIKDMGTETEKYARQNFIAKDAIDKTTQSQAALAIVLDDVGRKFDGVTADKFVSEMEKATTAIQNASGEFGKAFTFAVQDLLDKLEITKKGVPVLEQFFELSKELSEQEAAPIMQAAGEGLGGALGAMLDKQQQKIDETRAKMGQLAKASEEVADILLGDLAKASREHVENLVATGKITDNVFEKAAAYDAKLAELAGTYGIAKKAQNEFGSSALFVGQAINRGVVPAINSAKTAYVDFINTSRSKLSEFVTGAGFQAFKKSGDVADLFKGGKKATKKPRRGGGRRGPSRAEIRRIQEGFLPPSADPFADMVEPDDFAAQQFMDARELAADNVKAFYEFQEVFREIDALNFEIENMPIMEALEKLSTGFDRVSSAAQTMDQAVQSLGGSPGFANVTSQIETLSQRVVEFAQTNEKTAGTYGALAGSIVEASGQAALGFVKGEKERAGISAAMETARAGAAFAMFASTLSPNYAVAGSMHLVNAGLFAAIAGGAGGGSRPQRAAAGGARNIPQFGQMGPNQQPQAAQVVVNMDGAIVAGANRRKTANDLGDLVQESMGARR